MKTSHLFTQTLSNFNPTVKFTLDYCQYPFDYFKEFAKHQIET